MFQAWNVDIIIYIYYISYFKGKGLQVGISENGAISLSTFPNKSPGPWGR